MDDNTREVLKLVIMHGIKGPRDWDIFAKIRLLSRGSRDLTRVIFKQKRDSIWKRVIKDRCVHYEYGSCYDGYYELRRENGAFVERSNWKNGKREGLCEYGPHGARRFYERVNCKNDVKDGLYESYLGEQIIERSNWKNGVKHGICERYEIDGRVGNISNWKNGEPLPMLR